MLPCARAKGSSTRTNAVSARRIPHRTSKRDHRRRRSPRGTSHQSGGESIRTGVTAVLPHSGNLFQSERPGGCIRRQRLRKTCRFQNGARRPPNQFWSGTKPGNGGSKSGRSVVQKSAIGPIRAQSARRVLRGASKHFHAELTKAQKYVVAVDENRSYFEKVRDREHQSVKQKHRRERERPDQQWSNRERDSGCDGWSR